MNFSASTFVSLKWKVFILTSVALVFVTVSYSSVNYLEMQRLFRDRSDIAYRLYTQQIEALIEQNNDNLRQLGTMVASLPVIHRALDAQYSEKPIADIEEFWTTLLLDMGIELLSVYSASGQLLLNLGFVQSGKIKLNLVDVVTEVNDSEQPSTLNECVPTCMEIVVVPVLGIGKSVGAIALGASLADTILDFHSLTRSDMGLIIASSESITSGESGWLPNWKMRIEAMSNINKNIQVLRNMSDQYAFKDIVGKSTNIYFGDRTYEVRLTRFPGFYQPDAPYIVLVTDITDELSNIRETTAKSIGLGAIALFGTSFLILAFLWKPLRRLRRAADYLPLLAQGQFNEVRGGISPNTAPLPDEIDVLEETTISTSNLLESLQNAVSKRNQALSQQAMDFRRERDFVTRVLDTAQVIVMTHDEQTGIDLLNRYGEVLTGYSNNELRGKTFATLLSSNNLLPDITHNIDDLFAGYRNRLRQDTEITCKDGTNRNVIWHHARLEGTKTPLILSVGLDITERKKAESKLSWLANRDPLTGSFNRRRFHEELSEAVARAKRYMHNGALLFMDLDKFKYINDTSGHQYGDLIIREVGKRLERNLRKDVDIIGRVGGDEFAVILPEATKEDAKHVAEKLLKNLADIHVTTAGRTQKVSASIGIALFPLHGSDIQELLTAADLAMYQVKDTGRGGWHVYSPKDQTLERLQKRVLWKERIEQTLEEKSFQLYFQPILDIRRNSVNCYEVLLRIFGEDGMIIPTTQVIKIAEQEGLIHLLDRTVLEASIDYLAELLKEGLNVTFFVNLSPYAFNDSDLTSYLSRVLQKAKLEADHLVIEITETAALSDLTAAKDLIMEIKSLGCRFALDDFGVGFSSFHHLQELPVDIVKIDGSYIQRLADMKNNRAIVNVINELSHDAGIKTVAEFVEDADTLKCLKSLQIDFAQGYYVGHPAPANRLFRKTDISVDRVNHSVG